MPPGYIAAGDCNLGGTRGDECAGGVGGFIFDAVKVDFIFVMAWGGTVKKRVSLYHAYTTLVTPIPPRWVATYIQIINHSITTRFHIAPQRELFRLQVSFQVHLS